MRKYKVILIIAVVVLQAAALAAVVMQRETVLQDGDLVFMRTLPVDPRDLLRGDYVRLGYEVANIPAERVRAEEFKEMQKPERRVYLAYSTDFRNVMVPEKLTLSRPQGQPLFAG